MEYIVIYWCANWSDLTGLNENDVINDEQLMELIHNEEVNVMVYHAEDKHYCWIDGKDQNFNQR